MVLKLNAMRQGLVHRATLSNLGESFSLRFVEIALDVNIAGDLFNKTSIRYIAVFAIVCVNT